MPSKPLRTIAVTAAFALAASLASLPGPLTAAAKAPAASKTSTAEKKRADAVPTPKLRWYRCYDYAECVTVKLPRDYDRPKGAKVELALLRVKARNQKRKIGSLFVNPGGPGGSGTEFALFSPFLFGDTVLERFDIVGLDPRGTNFSDNVQCFANPGEQQAFFQSLPNGPFPYLKSEETAAIKAYRTFGRECSTTGKPLSVSMSTAEVARDMDVLRRAVGDTHLSFLGFSYGSYLGQVYANLFPDRVRAVAIDGVLDPGAWAGTSATRNVPMSDRLRSADGASKALVEILRRCDRAGGASCSFAIGDPVKNFELVAQRLKAKPFTSEDPDTGETSRYGYPELVSELLFYLYLPFGYQLIADTLSQLLIITEPPASGRARASSIRQQALRALAELRSEARDLSGGPVTPGRYGFPYNSSFDGFASVACTDSLNPRELADWPTYAANAERRVKHFGRLWTWNVAMCASKTWTGKDEDAYRGPWDRRTANPVLVVGNYWDPATNYAGAVKASQLLPNSRLLSSDSWGHTAYGTSECVTTAVEAYLVSLKLPAKGTVCVGDDQPFAGQPEEPEESSALVRLAALVKRSPLR